MSSRSALPPGPSLPAPLQMVGFWTRPLAFMDRCRERYGKRFTIRLPFTPPFVYIADPDEVKQIFTAPPDVLHPGRGAKVLEPVVGRNSVILLDEGEHMEQRKLMLPAFHGERMERLTGLVEEVAAEEVAALPRDVPLSLHPRMQDLTLKIILRAVFGLDPGPRFDALRERLAAMLEFGDCPISLMPPEPDSMVAKVAERVGPFAQFVRMQAEVDESLFALIDERRAAGADRDDVLAMLLEATHEDGSPMSDEEIHDELLTLLVAGHETTATTLAWAFERLVREPAVLERLVAEIDAGDDAYVTATSQETLRDRPDLPHRGAALRGPRGDDRRLDLPARRQPARQHLPDPPRPRDLPRPPRLPPRALPGQHSGHLHLDPLRRRPSPMPRCQLRDARDEGRPQGSAGRLRAARLG